MMRFNKIVFPVRRRGSTGAIGSQGPAAPLTTADEARLATVEETIGISGGDTLTLYVDGTNGDNNNDGLSRTTALETLDAAIALRNELKVTRIRVMSDCNHDGRPVISIPCHIAIERDPPITADVKITTINNSNISLQCPATLSFTGINIELNGSSNFISCFTGSVVNLRISGVVVTSGASGTAALITRFGGALIFFAQNADFSAVLGDIFNYVASGDDPNDDVFTISNITSA